MQPSLDAWLLRHEAPPLTLSPTPAQDSPPSPVSKGSLLYHLLLDISVFCLLKMYLCFGVCRIYGFGKLFPCCVFFHCCMFWYVSVFPFYICALPSIFVLSLGAAVSYTYGKHVLCLFYWSGKKNVYFRGSLCFASYEVKTFTLSSTVQNKNNWQLGIVILLHSSKVWSMCIFIIVYLRGCPE